MSRKKKKKTARRDEIRDAVQLAKLRGQIAQIDLVCPGILVKRYLTCGNVRCRCHQDPEARHGPYCYWSRRERGKLVQTVVQADRAAELKRAIANQRRVLRLLAQWGSKSARLILEV